MMTEIAVNESPVLAVPTTGHWSQARIADLSPLEIQRMSDAELADVILASDLPILRPVEPYCLELYDRPTLERLVYLARRCCRNRGF